MKIFFGTLLFTFVVLLISIEDSSQSSSKGGGHDVPIKGREQPLIGREQPLIGREEPLIVRVRMLNKPLGHRIIMPNGALYESNGQGIIQVRYGVERNTVSITQGVNTVNLDQGPFTPSLWHDSPGTSVLRVHRNNLRRTM